MSHEIIIIDVPDVGLAAPAVLGGTVKSAEIRWAPSHDLTPDQQIRRAERAERKLGKIREMLEAPANAPDGDD